MKQILVLLLCISLAACIYRKPYSLALEEIPCDERVLEKIKEGTVFLQDNNKRYELANPVFTDSTVSGTIVWKVGPDGKLKSYEEATRKELKRERKNVIIHLKNNIEPLSASIANNSVPLSISTTIRVEQIAKVETLKLDKKESIASTLLLIVLGFLLIILLVYLLIVAIGAASEEASGQSSDGSNSGNSDSGNSGGSGSNSGSGNGGSGSDSNSGGCYIATMVYGNYDAAEVLVLRKFRDKVLAPTLAGRCFITCYYTLSPTLVRWFRHSVWVNVFCKILLDRLVTLLSK